MKHDPITAKGAGESLPLLARLIDIHILNPLTNHMNFARSLVGASLIAAFAFSSTALVNSARAADDAYLANSHLNPVELLAPPPLPDSAEQAADLAEVRAVHAAAAGADTAAAAMEEKLSVWVFAPAIGTYFDAARLPKTAAFFKRVQHTTETFEEEGKNFWKRPRPYVVDPSLANGKPEKSFSYPSGHSLRGTVYALVLADLVPDKRDAILAKGREIGWHRVELARHYPTDIYAGRVLAQAVVRELKTDPAFEKDFADIKAELAAARTSATN